MCEPAHIQRAKHTHIPHLGFSTQKLSPAGIGLSWIAITAPEDRRCVDRNVRGYPQSVAAKAVAERRDFFGECSRRSVLP
jgi:hypothetical protein